MKFGIVTSSISIIVEMSVGTMIRNHSKNGLSLSNPHMASSENFRLKESCQTMRYGPRLSPYIMMDFMISFKILVVFIDGNALQADAASQ